MKSQLIRLSLVAEEDAHRLGDKDITPQRHGNVAIGIDGRALEGRDAGDQLTANLDNITLSDVVVDNSKRFCLVCETELQACGFTFSIYVSGRGL